MKYKTFLPETFEIIQVPLQFFVGLIIIMYILKRNATQDDWRQLTIHILSANLNWQYAVFRGLRRMSYVSVFYPICSFCIDSLSGEKALGPGMLSGEKMKITMFILKETQNRNFLYVSYKTCVFWYYVLRRVPWIG